MNTKIWAHRGSSHKYIENTLAAFEQAIEDQADGIELDVQRTKDGKLIVYHDENLKRLTGHDANVWEMTWEEIKTLSLSSKNKTLNSSEASNTRIPCLDEVLLLMADAGLVINIELKNSIYFYPGMEEEVVECVKNNGVEDHVIFSSFNHESVRKLSQLVGADKVGLLTSDIQFEPWNYLTHLGAKAFHPMLNSLQQKELMANMRANEIDVHVWTVDEEVHIYAALLLGVDAIITNKPDRAIALRKKFIEDGGAEAQEMVASLGLL